MGVSVPLVRKPQGNPAMIGKAMPIVVTGAQIVAVVKMHGGNRFSSLSRKCQSTAAQTVQAVKANLNHNGATIAVSKVGATGTIIAGNATMASVTVLVATTR